MTALYLVTVTNDTEPGTVVLAVEAQSQEDAQVAALHRAFRQLGWWFSTAAVAVPAEIVHVDVLTLTPEQEQEMNA